MAHSFKSLLLVSCASLAFPFAAVAQETPAPSTAVTQEPSRGEEIVVTARKRDETQIEVPVTLTAVSGAELERRAINNLDGLTRMVPQLQLGAGGGTVQGGHVGLRGISGSDSNPFADQAVSFNVDGVQVARSNIRRMAEMDLAVVEVLKGPQALFFGKNSPGGIISLRSADPTSRLTAKMSAAYEFNAREVRGEGFISGPITDTLGARLAVSGSTMSGWFHNDFPEGRINSPTSDRAPKTEEFGVRGTLKWEPSDRFDARLKVTFNKVKDIGPLATAEHVFCARGAGNPQIGVPGDDCKANGRGSRGNLTGFLASIQPPVNSKDHEWRSDGIPYIRLKQALVAYEMNYDLTDALALTSVTGYYYLDQRFFDTFNIGGFSLQTNLPSTGHFGVKEFSEELRLTSSYDGPINFMLGGFYQKARAFTGNKTTVGSAPNPTTGANPTQLNNFFLFQRGTAYSVFGQLIYNPIEQIELTAGGRYSYEKKRLTRIETQIAPPGPGPLPRVVLPENPLFPRKDSWENFSPEFTASYRPNRDLNIYASYKRGFLSGGFNSGATNFNSDLRFDQQKIKGFEAGVKAALLDGALRTNLAAYHYVITGLQITTSLSINNVPVQTVLNAGKSTVKGVEFDFVYDTPLEGLNVHAALGYNDTKYDVFSVGCYNGQSQAEGCNAGLPNPTTGNFALQDLSGFPILRAPKWSGSAGIGYENDLNEALKIGFNLDATYSSSYYTNANANPNGIQKKYALLDASVRLATQDDAWEFALIGRNLTDKYYVIRTVDAPLTGSTAANGSVAGGLKADLQGAVNRGREIMARVTWKFGE